MLKPPISRMGVKSKLRKTIIGMIPDHTCYVEPFFGAGWVFFGKDPSKVEVINDIDGELINLFKMIKYHEAEVSRLMQYEVCSRERFNYYMDLNVAGLTDGQRAIRYIYIFFPRASPVRESTSDMEQQADLTHRYLKQSI